jgi:hypothetical protein
MHLPLQRDRIQTDANSIPGAVQLIEGWFKVQKQSINQTDKWRK